MPTGSVIDNQLMRVIAETGGLGLFFYLWMWGALFKQGLRLYKDNPDDRLARGIALGFLSAFVGLLFHSMSAASFIIIRIMEPFWLMAALVFALPIIRGQQKRG